MKSLWKQWEERSMTFSKNDLKGTGQVFSFTFLSLLKNKANIIAMVIFAVIGLLAVPAVLLFGGSGVSVQTGSALSGVAAGVEIIVLSRCVLHALHIILEHIQPELTDVRLGGTQVHGVRCVRYQPVDVMFFRIGEKCLDICLVDRLGSAASGVSCEKGERCCPQFHGVFSHGEIALGRGQMVSDSQHR